MANSKSLTVLTVMSSVFALQACTEGALEAFTAASAENAELSSQAASESTDIPLYSLGAANPTSAETTIPFVPGTIANYIVNHISIYPNYSPSPATDEELNVVVAAETDPSEVPEAAPDTDSPAIAPDTDPSEVPAVVPETVPSEVAEIAPDTDPSEVPAVVPETVPSEVAEIAPDTDPSEVPAVVPETVPSEVAEIAPDTDPSEVVEITPETGPAEVADIDPETELPEDSETAPETDPSEVADSAPEIDPSDVVDIAPEPDEVMVEIIDFTPILEAPERGQLFPYGSTIEFVWSMPAAFSGTVTGFDIAISDVSEGVVSYRNNQVAMSSCNDDGLCSYKVNSADIPIPAGDNMWSVSSVGGSVGFNIADATFTLDEQPEVQTAGLSMLTPAVDFVADSSSVDFSWEDPSRPNAVYDLHVYSDAGRTQKVTGTNGVVFDTSGIGTATSHTFTDDPSDGAARYGVLLQWADAAYDPDFKQEILFEYTAHTKSETKAVSSSEVPEVSELLVHLALEDSQTPTVALDSSANGNSGTITGATYEFDSGDGSASSLRFDGSGGVNLGKLDVSGTGLTLAAWIRADSFPGPNQDPRIISKAKNISTDSHVFMLSTVKRGSSNDTVLRGRVRADGVTRTYRANTGLLIPGVWYHAAMVYDESTLKLYLDGIEVASHDMELGPVAQDSTSDVVVGANPSGGYNWDGNIDDVLIAQRPLEPMEIMGLAMGEPMKVGTVVESVSQPEEGSVSVPEVAEVSEETSPQITETPSELTTEYVPGKQTTEVLPVLGAANSTNNIAFPGALGWAADTTTGGRGGRVVIVDSLSNLVDPNDGVTTFREAMSEINEPRIIVFAVAGLIDYRSGPTIPASTLRLNNSDSNVTIACQTAPPPGITLMGDGINFANDTNNVIIRHCRFRNSDPKTIAAADNSSCIRATGTTPNSAGEVQRNFVMDHVSCMWATDDPLAFMIPKLGGDNGGNIENISLSNSIVSEGDADSLHKESGLIPLRYTHSMGPGCASASTKRTIDRCSMARNILAHNGRRNGQFWGVDGAEIINNIIYNPNEIGISAKSHYAKNIDGFIVGNLIQFGPTSKEAAKPIDLGGNTALSARLEISGNYLGQYRSSTPEPYNNPPGSNTSKPTTQQVTPTLDILEMSRPGSDHLRCVGASRPRRDTHDQRVIDQFHQQSGQVGVLENHERDFSEYSTEPVSHSWSDNDRDGMPDSWESKMGVDKSDEYDLSFVYTNLEVFLNRIALCPSIHFESETVFFKAGTRELRIPFESTWETWVGGQSFEVCVGNICKIYHDSKNSGTVTASIPSDGEYQLTMTPIGSDGMRESIFGSVNLSVGR